MLTVFSPPNLKGEILVVLVAVSIISVFIVRVLVDLTARNDITIKNDKLILKKPIILNALA